MSDKDGAGSPLFVSGWGDGKEGGGGGLGNDDVLIPLPSACCGCDDFQIFSGMVGGGWKVGAGNADLFMLLGPTGHALCCDGRVWFTVEEVEEGRWSSGSLRIFNIEQHSVISQPST